MRVLCHPELPKDIRRCERDYQEISVGLGARFRDDVDDALEAIKSSPEASAHFLQTGSKVVRQFRRCISRRSRSSFLTEP